MGKAKKRSTADHTRSNATPIGGTGCAECGNQHTDISNGVISFDLDLPPEGASASDLVEFLAEKLDSIICMNLEDYSGEPECHTDLLAEVFSGGGTQWRQKLSINQDEPVPHQVAPYAYWKAVTVLAQQTFTLMQEQVGADNGNMEDVSELGMQILVKTHMVQESLWVIFMGSQACWEAREHNGFQKIPLLLLVGLRDMINEIGELACRFEDEEA